MNLNVDKLVAGTRLEVSEEHRFFYNLEKYWIYVGGTPDRPGFYTIQGATKNLTAKGLLRGTLEHYFKNPIRTPLQLENK